MLHLPKCCLESRDAEQNKQMRCWLPDRFGGRAVSACGGRLRQRVQNGKVECNLWRASSAPDRESQVREGGGQDRNGMSLVSTAPDWRKRLKV